VNCYLLTNGKDYTYDDLLHIAKGQLALEDEIAVTAHHTKPLFIDTDMYVMKVWCEFVFGKCHRYILEQIVDRKYDLYLLCNTDLPWTEEELREYPDPAVRQKLYAMYKDIMINQPVPWAEISGDHIARLAKATERIDRFLREV
jgi:nicotinamide riboside kinase